MLRASCYHLLFLGCGGCLQSVVEAKNTKSLRQYLFGESTTVYSYYYSVFHTMQLLLVSANPHLYEFGILTVWCAMFVCIIITSIPFTIDQIFIKEEEYRITPK